MTGRLKRQCQGAGVSRPSLCQPLRPFALSFVWASPACEQCHAETPTTFLTILLCFASREQSCQAPANFSAALYCLACVAGPGGACAQASGWNQPTRRHVRTEWTRGRPGPELGTCICVNCACCDRPAPSPGPRTPAATCSRSHRVAQGLDDGQRARSARNDVRRPPRAVRSARDASGTAAPDEGGEAAAEQHG